MKELDQFTVEQLEKYSKLEALTFPPSHAQVAALARIALAAKKATTSYWITYYPNPDPNEFDDREHSHSGAKSCAVRIAGEIGGFVVPVYHGAPQLKYPENLDCWVACSERMPESKPGKMWSKEVAAVTNLGDVFKLSCMGDYWQRTSEFVDSGATSITHWIPLPAEYKPEK